MVASGQVVDPPIADLVPLTTASTAWAGVAPWPAEIWWERIGALFASHRLAIALGDVRWLAQLYQAWDAAPEDLRHPRLRAQGEIGLALRPQGPRAFGWTADELEELVEESHLLMNAPDDQAWVRLVADDRTGAQQALAAYDAQLAARAAARVAAAPDVAVREILTYPGEILRIESRALHVLIG